MFRPQKNAAPKVTAMSRQESAIWLGRALSSNQVVLQAMLQLLHVVGVQQQVLQALVRQQYGQSLEDGQSDALQGAKGEAGKDILRRLEELEVSLQPVLQAVEQACISLQKEI
jgi:hypothetical protein